MITLTRTFLICVACVLTVTTMAGCAKNRDHHDHTDLTTGRQLFNFHCAECHGEDGTGRLVDKIPANILTTRDVEGIESYIVTDTGKGRKMPVFATMPRGEAHEIAEYLIELKNRYASLGENQRKNRELLIDPEKRE
jgi:mono/diheme cytochrome c family protein